MCIWSSPQFLLLSAARRRSSSVARTIVLPPRTTATRIPPRTIAAALLREPLLLAPKLPHFPLPTHGVVVHGGIPNEFEDENGDVDVELSGACAGPLVTVPHVGDVVYYFPQCHLKQI
ncbi:hypothetical protein Scep_025659 [Stephania cephalantha]|uniref:Uncharacterized protein n=1 Tax=Stephania cephalantha TaxID=152367 RepID=A0AAP0EL60_9MAGN